MTPEQQQHLAGLVLDEEMRRQRNGRPPLVLDLLLRTPEEQLRVLAPFVTDALAAVTDRLRTLDADQAATKANTLAERDTLTALATDVTKGAG